jgi:hypothetical protein
VVVGLNLWVDNSSLDAALDLGADFSPRLRHNLRLRGLMAFEKITQPYFPGRGSDRVSLARLFKAGTLSVSISSRGSDG